MVKRVKMLDRELAKDSAAVWQELQAEREKSAALLEALRTMTAACERVDVGMRDRETAASIPAARAAIARATE